MSDTIQVIKPCPDCGPDRPYAEVCGRFGQLLKGHEGATVIELTEHGHISKSVWEFNQAVSVEAGNERLSGDPDEIIHGSLYVVWDIPSESA